MAKLLIFALLLAVPPSWAQLTGGGNGTGGTGISGVNVQLDGTPVTGNPATTFNFTTGTGMACNPSPIVAGVAAILCNPDTNYLQSRINLQSGTNPLMCSSSSASGTVYTATCAMALTAYSVLQNLFWYTDVTNSGTTPTLNINGLGARTLVKHDGTALAANDIKATTLYRIWNDGSNIHVVEAGLSGGTVGINGVPFCSGFTPTNTQLLQYTTGGSPNPCWNAATVSSGGGVGSILSTVWGIAGLYQASASSTNYWIINAVVGGSNPPRSDQLNQTPLSSIHTATNLCVTNYGVGGFAQPSSGTMTFTLRDLTTLTALVATIPINGGSGQYCSSGSVSVGGVGHAIDLEVKNNATGNSTVPIIASMELN